MTQTTSRESLPHHPLSDGGRRSTTVLVTQLIWGPRKTLCVWWLSVGWPVCLKQSVVAVHDCDSGRSRSENTTHSTAYAHDVIALCFETPDSS